LQEQPVGASSSDVHCSCNKLEKKLSPKIKIKKDWEVPKLPWMFRILTEMRVTVRGLEGCYKVRFPAGVKRGITSGSVGIGVDVGLEKAHWKSWLDKFHLRGT
jgi:hypothetical protein